MTATEAPTLEPDVVEATEAAERTRHAPLWKVLFHDDDVTPMDFVTAVLMRFFGHDLQTAMRIMLTVHHTGLGLAGEDFKILIATLAGGKFAGADVLDA